MDNRPVYDFSSDIFKKNPFYKRLAKDHLSLFDIESDVIEWEVVNTRGALKIPCEYHFHFRIKSIVGLNKDNTPVFGDHHIAKVTFPPKYPIEAPELYMQTDLWHPNIKSEGRYKGRICGNTKGFGLGFDLFLLVIRIGEILQFKQYHAENTPPFPEDIKAARWLLEFGEPSGLVNKYQDICIDNTPLVKNAEIEGLVQKEKDVHFKVVEIEEEVAPEPPQEVPSEEVPIIKQVDATATTEGTKDSPPSAPGRMKISILSTKKADKKKISIQKKDE
jgi:hypothetical protein